MQTHTYLNEARRDNERLFRLLSQSADRVSDLEQENRALRRDLNVQKARNSVQQSAITRGEVKIIELKRENIGMRRMLMGAVDVAREVYTEGRRCRGFWSQERFHVFGKTFLSPSERTYRRGDLAGDAENSHNHEETAPAPGVDSSSDSRTFTPTESQHRRLLASGMQPQALEGDCPICREPYNIDNPAHYETILPCGHGFHDECMREWANQGMTCPYCRQEFRWVLANREDVPAVAQARSFQRQRNAEFAEIATLSEPTLDEVTAAAAIHAEEEIVRYGQLVIQQREALAELTEGGEEQQIGIGDSNNEAQNGEGGDGDDDNAEGEAADSGSSVIEIADPRSSPRPTRRRQQQFDNLDEFLDHLDNHVLTPPGRRSRHRRDEPAGAPTSAEGLQLPRRSMRSNGTGAMVRVVEQQLPFFMEEPEVQAARAAQGLGDVMVVGRTPATIDVGPSEIDIEVIHASNPEASVQSNGEHQEDGSVAKTGTLRVASRRIEGWMKRTWRRGG